MINYKYIINVKDFMPLPKPTKKLLDCDGEILPLVSVEVGIWEPW